MIDDNDMQRFFNTAGPVVPGDHYQLDPLKRFDLPELLSLIDQKKYFILHAPRQSGKTSSMLALVRYLNEGGRYYGLYVNVEGSQPNRNNFKGTIEGIAGLLGREAAYHLKTPALQNWIRENKATSDPATFLQLALSVLCEHLDRPLVLMIDEIDALIGDSLVAVLRQIRAGYPDRPVRFPHSLILCGVRDIRDYRIHTSSEAPITGGSAFNIKAASLTLGNFTLEEVRELYLQHTELTGQEFSPGVIERAHHLTQGQPWLVNALAYRACWEHPLGKKRNREQPITLEILEECKEKLILDREVHIDQLIHKLGEDRVRRVIGPILAGQGDGEEQDQADKIKPGDLEYCLDLGLITIKPRLMIANPIYKEVIPRELTWVKQLTMVQEQVWYLLPDGRIDTFKLMRAFQDFYRQNSDFWLEGMPYREAAPQLLLMAFLQRIINGGGKVDREYGLGRKRIDVCVHWPQGKQVICVELKVLRKEAREAVLGTAIEQLRDYMDKAKRSDCTIEGHLVLFDARAGKTWEEKIFHEEIQASPTALHAWGC